MKRPRKVKIEESLTEKQLGELLFVLEGWGEGTNTFTVRAKTANTLNQLYDKFVSYRELFEVFEDYSD